MLRLYTMPSKRNFLLSLTLCLALQHHVNAASIADNTKVKTLLISLDGMRWDYIQNTENTVTFDKLIAEGSQVKKVTVAFATVTMPNHWTLVTGMNEEDHGIINNKFLDPDTGNIYSYSTESEWYNNTTPIWITAERAGIKSGSYMWIGNQALYDGKSISKVTPFSGGTTFRSGLDTVIQWFSQDDVDFACLYTDQPDKQGHEHGPDSQELKDKVKELDGEIGYFLEKLEENGLADRVNLVITSDHGMTNVHANRTIVMSNYLDYDEDIEWSYFSANGLIVPKPGKTEKVYAILKNVSETSEPHMKVYRKSEIPDDLYYKNNSRIPEIIVIPDLGWILKKVDYDFTLLGNHGFDNKFDDMKTTLIAHGPAFRKGYQQETMRSVDVYPMLCEVLGLTTCHQSRGDLSATKSMLLPKPTSSAPTTLSINNLSTWLFVCIVAAFVN